MQLLLAHSASCRIVNNKGQSVLSLAASHLQPATVEMVQASEVRRGEEAEPTRMHV